LIRCDNISKEFGERLLFDSIDYHFPEDERLALVGPNGAGKTTFLRILTSEMEASSGRILMPTRCRLGYLPQEPNQNPKKSIVDECVTGAQYLNGMHDRLADLVKQMETDVSEKVLYEYTELEEEFRELGGYAVESEAREILYGLGFRGQMLTKDPRDLSGGWRMRLELAKVFMNHPNFLILDEPTNHLDLPSLVWVEQYLLDFKGTLLFVSHDRDLLNRLATVTLELRNGNIKPYRGNFDKFLELKEVDLEHDRNALKQLERKKKDLQGFVDRFGAKASKAKQAQSRVKQIQRLESMETQYDTGEGDSVMAIGLRDASKSVKQVLSIEKGSIGYGDLILAGSMNLFVERGMKVAIIGANGIGKSTLLRTIVGATPNLGGTFKVGDRVNIGYFSQDQVDTLDGELSCLDNVMNVSDEVGQKEARQLLGNFLFSGQDVFKPVKVLSGGEKSRIGLACSLAQAANFLILDEPTNHLDMSSVEILTSALRKYKSTLLFVSHDRRFINRVCTHVFVLLPDGRSELFEGNLRDYARLAKVSGFPNVLDAKQSLGNEEESVKKAKPTNTSKNSSRKDVKKLMENLTKVERTELEVIERLSGEIEQLNSQINELDEKEYSALAQLHQQIDLKSEEKSGAEERCLEIQQKIEDLQS